VGLRFLGPCNAGRSCDERSRMGARVSAEGATHVGQGVSPDSRSDEPVRAGYEIENYTSPEKATPTFKRLRGRG
jgi:hypothetical protein